MQRKTLVLSHGAETWHWLVIGPRQVQDQNRMAQPQPMVQGQERSCYE